jgi:Na+-driven multidrug efflux pump
MTPLLVLPNLTNICLRLALIIVSVGLNLVCLPCTLIQALVKGIPLGFWLAFVRQWGLPGLWAGLMVAMAVASIVGCIVLLSSVWRSPPSMVLVGSAIIPKVDARIEQV